MASRLRLGQVWVDAVTLAEALDAVEGLVTAGQGGMVFTPNVDHVVNVESDPAFREAYSRASLSLADGMPLVWASRLLRTSLPERVPGSELVVPLLERAAQRGWRVYFLGAGPGVAQRAAEIVRERWSVNVVGTSAPLVRLDDGPAIDALAEEVRAAAPHLLFLALGAPKQELLADRIAARIRPTVSLGVGASLDFIAGTVKRAPALVRRVGMEWLYRLAQEPRRLWRRYLVNDPKFALILLRTLRDEWGR